MIQAITIEQNILTTISNCNITFFLISCDNSSIKFLELLILYLTNILVIEIPALTNKTMFLSHANSRHSKSSLLFFETKRFFQTKK